MNEPLPQHCRSLFVYGTLLSGHRRHDAWPHPATSVEVAWVWGQLVDLGPYPALLPGPHRVLGELRSFTPETWPETLARLDAIEGFANQTDDLYRRTSTHAVTLHDNIPVPCQTYTYAQPVPPSATPIPPGPDGFVRWTKSPRDEG